MAEERIQKIMSEQGLCSRRAAEQIIAEGRVKVNGHPVKVGDKMDPNRDVLHVDDERIYIQNGRKEETYGHKKRSSAELQPLLTLNLIL